MNKIRELREQRKLSSYDLAEMVGTYPSTIHKLETGKQRLTVEWMERIAKALNVMPSELLIENVIGSFNEEASLYVAEESSKKFTDALANINQFYYEITISCLDKIGIKDGDVRLFKISQEAVDNVQIGDVVIAQAYDEGDASKTVTIVRQFVPPSLLITNSTKVRDRNIDLDEADVVIKGVMIHGAELPK